MFNLLPDSEKKFILAEYANRRTVAALAFLFVLGLIASISAFPAFLLSSAKVSEVREEIEAVRQSKIFQEESSLSAELQKTQGKISSLHPKEAFIPVETVFTRIITHRGDGIRMNGLRLSATTDAERQILVNGIARDRDALLSFVHALEEDPLFSSVDLPVSNFTRDRNAEFSLTIHGTF